MLGTIIHASSILTHLIHTTNLQGRCYDPHFINEETATSHVEVILAKSHSYQTAELGHELSPLLPELMLNSARACLLTLSCHSFPWFAEILQWQVSLSASSTKL